MDYSFEVHRLLNRKRTSIAFIIPAFNEGKRISTVLNVLVNFPVLSEIIVVNDGSSDNTLDVMNYYARTYSKIKVVDIQPNQGKTNAVKKGIESSKSELISLVDADLQGLSHDYLYKMLYFVLSGEFDMTILDRGGDRMAPLGIAASWVVRFIGGERAFWRKDFEKVKFAKGSRYAIEQEINLYYMENDLSVRTIYCPDLKGEYQWNKKGLLPALESYAKITREIYKHSHTQNFYYQVGSIVEDRIEPLYKILKHSKVKKPVVGAIVATGLVVSIGTFLWLNLRRKKFSKDN